MHLKLKPLGSILLMITAFNLKAAYATTFTQIPDVSYEVHALPPIKLTLELVINEYSTQQMVLVIAVDDHYYVEKKILEDLEIDPSHFFADSGLSPEILMQLGFDADPLKWVQLDQQAEVTAEYAVNVQQMHLSVPASWLPEQQLGKDFWYKRSKAQSGVGVVNNYDLYFTRPHAQSSSLSIFTEQRFFNAWGILRNTGTFHSYQDQQLHKKSNQQKNDYIRFDSSWRFDIEDQANTVELGDIYSASKNAWTQSLRLAGIQLRRNYSIRPDLITYPLPQFNGQAALPSTVDLFINGVKNATDDVQPGPFVLSNVPFINGRGEAVVVTTDAVGRQVSTAVPFYVSGDLLKPSLLDYSVSVGKLRENYGIKNFDYGEWVASADLRYGLSEWITTEAHFEATEDLWNIGLGQVFKLWNLGVINGSYAYSQSNGQAQVQARRQNLSQAKGQEESALAGYKIGLGYQYQQAQFGLNVLHSRQSQNYQNAASYYTDGLISVQATQSTVANINISSKSLGTWGLGYFNFKQDQDQETALLNLSWSPVLPQYLYGTTLSMTANRDLNQNTWSAGLQLNIPLGQTRGSISSSYQHQAQGPQTTTLNYNVQMPTEGGLGVSLSHRASDENHAYNQAQVSYQNRYFNLQAGLSGDDHYDQWYGLTGGIVWMKNSVFLTNQIGDSFSLISTQGQQQIPILYENTLIGHTDRNGFLFVPNVTPYHHAKYAIDPLNLDSNLATPVVEQRMSAKQGAGVVIEFPVKKITGANVYLLDEQGQPIRVGSLVYQQDRTPTYVGIDGIVFIEDLDADNQLRVVLSPSESCIATFKADLNQSHIINIPNVQCQSRSEDE